MATAKSTKRGISNGYLRGEANERLTEETPLCVNSYRKGSYTDEEECRQKNGDVTAATSVYPTFPNIHYQQTQQHTPSRGVMGQGPIQEDSDTWDIGPKNASGDTALKPGDNGQNQDTGDIARNPGKTVAPHGKLEFSLEQAKDRAQITATTSMSIVHVALLKQMVDTGPEQRYYSLILYSIITALALQVVAGLLALYVSLLRVYYTKYKDDFLHDCLKFCCPWKCGSKEDSDASDGEGCPCVCTSNYFAKHEEFTIEIYDEWAKSTVKVDKQMARVVAALNKRSAELLKNIAVGGIDPHGKAEPCEFENIKKHLSQAEWIRSRSEGLWKDQEKLVDEVEEIERQTVLKRATFWQSVITVLLYVVFVLNAFIVAFGLPAAPDDGAVVAANVTKCD